MNIERGKFSSDISSAPVSSSPEESSLQSSDNSDTLEVKKRYHCAVGRRLRGKQKKYFKRGKVSSDISSTTSSSSHVTSSHVTSNPISSPPISSISTTTRSSSHVSSSPINSSWEELPSYSSDSFVCLEVKKCDRLPQLHPITSFSSVSGLSNVVLPSGLLAGTNRGNIISNSTVIEILVHLLCRNREPDLHRRELLFTALCKVIKQWNNSLYLPLYAFPELQEFRKNLLAKFGDLFEDIHSQITTKTAKLIIPRIQIPPSGSPLTQLALTDTYQHQFLDDRYTREYLELSVLGRGGFGVVVKAQNRLDGHIYAIKIIIMDKQDSENNKKLLREVQALAQLDHPNIVRYHSTWLQLFTVPTHLWPKSHAGRKLKKQQPHSQCLEKVERNRFFPTSQVKIQEISSLEPEKFEESSDGIVFMDGSRNNSNISKKTSKCKAIQENCESSFKCSSLEPEKFDESSGGIVFVDVSRSKSNISKKTNHCKTIHEGFESIYNSRTDEGTHDKKENFIPKNSVVDNKDVKTECNPLYIEKECVRSRFFKSEYSESLLATDSSFSCIKKESSSSYNGLVSNDDIEESVCKVKRLYTSASSSHFSRHLQNSLMLCQKHPKDTQMTLFIQMGLCGETLAEWISKRNTLPVQDKQSHVDRKECLDFFRQILLAVQNIHSKNIIHRDLKPPNIFFTEDGKHLKLGDFGLARSLPDTVLGEGGISADSSTNCSLTPILNHISNTGGLGTPIYAAPELKFGGIYGSECDMHNLGIILLELFYPFHTGSERVHVINNLKTKRWLELEFTHQWPDIAHWVLQLTDQDQTKRPTATALLKSELFSNEYGTVELQASNISFMGETTFQQQHLQSNTNQNHFGNLISNDLKIVHTDNQSFVQQENRILNIQAVKNLVKENKEKDEEIRKLLKENKEKDEEIRKLGEEKVKLQEMVAQTQERICQHSAVEQHQGNLKYINNTLCRETVKF